MAAEAKKPIIANGNETGVAVEVPRAYKMTRVNHNVIRIAVLVFKRIRGISL